MLWTSNRRERPGAWSTFTFTSLIRLANWRANASSAGLTMRHGPHHGAHRSTTTGIVAFSTTSWNSLSAASTIQGNHAPQLPHLGTPLADAGTRFLFPHVSHRTMSEATCPILAHTGTPPSPGSDQICFQGPDTSQSARSGLSGVGLELSPVHAVRVSPGQSGSVQISPGQSRSVVKVYFGSVNEGHVPPGPGQSAASVTKL